MIVENYVASRAKVIADSISESGNRLTTWECEWPRYCHADMMTHRVLSRNGRSSRAEPVQSAIARAINDPVYPIVWMYDEKRMQHGTVMIDSDAKSAQSEWFKARDNAVWSVMNLRSVGLHRQYTTRILEPFLRIKMVVSATSFANFYTVRIHPAPMPEVQQAVLAMARTQLDSKPRLLKQGDWHLPYITDAERLHYDPELLVKVSTSRCGRISYDSLDGKTVPIEDDVSLHDRLVGAWPVHASPAEHPARCMGFKSYRCGNFSGWQQYRKTLKNECVADGDFDLEAFLYQWEGLEYMV